MKRPLPIRTMPSSPSSSSLAALSLLALPNLALSSDSFVVPAFEGIERKKLDYEDQCVPLLTKAVTYDGDDSGGLDRTEFAQFWNAGLGGSADSTSTYDTLLCECYYTFGYHRSCCDDTSSDDEWQSARNANDDATDRDVRPGVVHWTEVSLVDFDADSPGKWEKHYHKQFCKRVQEMMEWEGIDLEDALNNDENAATDASEAPAQTTPVVTTTEATTTEEPVVTTKEPTTTTTKATTTTTTTEPTTATSEATTTTTKRTTTTTTEETTTTTTPSTTTSTITTEATTTKPSTSEATMAPIAANTTTTNTSASSATTTATSTATSSTTTTTTTTTTPNESTTTPVATPVDDPPTAEPIDPIAVTFVGSTNGNVEADSASEEFLDEVAHAFWRVASDVLEDMDALDDGRRKLETADRSRAEGRVQRHRLQERKQQGWGRRLFSDLGGDFAVYFESMKMHVEDVECSGGLAYAVEGAPCITFEYTLVPLPGGPLTESLAEEFVADVTSAADDDGDLYDALMDMYPDTEVVGMGSPGKGIPYEEESNTNQIVQLQGGSDSKPLAAAGGLPVGGYVGIYLAAVMVVVLMVGFVLKRRRDRQRQKKQNLDDSNLSEDIEANEVNADADRVEDWLDKESEEEKMVEESGDDDDDDDRQLRRQRSPASSLAAMGVASTVATRLSTGDTEVMLSARQPWSKKEPEV